MEYNEIRFIDEKPSFRNNILRGISEVRPIDAKTIIDSLVKDEEEDRVTNTMVRNSLQKLNMAIDYLNNKIDRTDPNEVIITDEFMNEHKAIGLMCVTEDVSFSSLRDVYCINNEIVKIIPRKNTNHYVYIPLTKYDHLIIRDVVNIEKIKMGLLTPITSIYMEPNLSNRKSFIDLNMKLGEVETRLNALIFAKKSNIPCETECDIVQEAESWGYQLSEDTEEFLGMIEYLR